MICLGKEISFRVQGREGTDLRKTYEVGIDSKKTRLVVCYESGMVSLKLIYTKVRHK